MNRERARLDSLARAKNHFLLAEKFLAAYSKGSSSPKAIDDMIRDLVHQSATMRTNNNLKINDDHKLSDRIKEKPLAVTASTLRGESEQRNFHAILDSAEVHYDSAWRLDNTLFSALVGLIKVQINKNRYERAFSIFQTETTEMGWDLKNVVFFQTLENTEFGHDNEVINKRMDFLYDLFSHLAA